MRNSNGITLIALIVTIIVMLILAGVVLTMAISENGIFKVAQLAKEESSKAQIQEEIQLELTSIVAEQVAQNNQINNVVIQEELTKRLLGIEVLENLTGTYKEYEYWIDEEYCVHIGEKINHPITVKLVANKVGTTTCTVTVDASSTEGNIIGYQYKFANKETEQITENTYTIEELEPNTSYFISVTVVDEKGNTKTSVPIKITTQSRTYLYKEGEEYVELTGGWKQGNHNIGTFVKESDHLNLYVNFQTNSIKYWNCCQTTNAIDVKDYTKIVYRLEISNMQYLPSPYDSWYTWFTVGVCNPPFAGYGNNNVKPGNPDFSNLKNNISTQRITSKVDITNVSELIYPTAYFARWYDGNYEVNVNIYEVWLEK